MEAWCNSYVHYNGQCDQASNYIGGDERMVYISKANPSISELRNNIKMIFEAENVRGEYNMYYTSKTSSGRVVRSLLATDVDLQRFCSFFSEHHIYLTFNNTSNTSVQPMNTGAGTSQREPSPYRPVMSPFSPQQYVSYSPTPEDLQRFRSSMFFDMASPGGSGGSHIPDLNTEAYEEEEEEEDDNDVVVSSDSDEADLDEESADSDDEDFRMNCTVAEFSAWIRSAGGMSAFVSNLMPTHPLPESSNIQGNLNNWLVPVMPLDTSEAPVVRDVAAILDQQLAKDSLFWSKDDLLVAVGLLHMELRQEFKVKRSDSVRVEYVCKRQESCTFKIGARCSAHCWSINKYNPNHSCGLNLAGIGARNVRSKVVVAYFARQMRRQGELIKPAGIMAELQRSFGIRTSYAVALRSRNAALSLLYGSIADSYALLPKYLEVLTQYNPGTVTDLDLAADGTFRHCFVALGVSRTAFLGKLVRQVIVVDATHLKGRSKDILFVAVTKDDNENVFPLALGVGPIENDESWTWFLSRLRMSFGCNNQLLIVSDQHISIGNAMSTVYPETAHGVCFYHLQNKLTSYGAATVKLYHRAAYAYRSEDFRQAMERIKASKPEAYAKLMSVGPERWARSKCRVRRFSFLTSNATEVFNARLLDARLLDARRLPVCSILDTYRGIVEKWFDERRAKAQGRVDDLTEEAVQKITPLVEIAHTYTVIPISPREFKVNDGQRIWKVDLEQCTCECREFQLDLMSCSHAAAVFRFTGRNLYHYVANYYTTSAWREMYGGTVHSLPPRGEWVVSEQAATVKVLPPNIIRQVGHPRNRRRPSGAESLSRQRARKKCSICRSENHTKRGCPEK